MVDMFMDELYNIDENVAGIIGSNPCPYSKLEEPYLK